MLVAARICTEFAANNSYESFAEDFLRQQGLIRQIQTVGEAASRVTDTMRHTLPGIPWADIIGMRHRLVHDYGRIDIETVWETIEDDLPKLIASLEPLGLESTD